jgi:hypothetical protein
MGRNRLDPTSAAEWVTRSKDLLMDLITEMLRAREQDAADRQRRNAESPVRKTKPPKSTATRAKRERAG